MNTDEKERQRALLHEQKMKERAQFEASLPISKTDVRDLFDHLDTNDLCDDTLKLTLEFIKARGLPKENVVAWLQQNGGFCDCEVIFNVKMYGIR